VSCRLSLRAQRGAHFGFNQGGMNVAIFTCNMWLSYEPVEPQFSEAASEAFDRIWPRSSEGVWQGMQVDAPNVEAMLDKLRNEFVANIAQLSPVPDKSAWTVFPPLQAGLWHIGPKGQHERHTTIEYNEGGVDKQWLMDYGGAAPTPVLVYAGWKEIRQL